MQVNDGLVRLGSAGGSRSARRAGSGGAGDTGATGGADEEGPAGGHSIRERQRRRRDEARIQADIEAVLAAPQDDEADEEDDEPAPAGPAPAKVFVVFRGAQWDDPDGALRESDSIAGVYATEDAARRAAAALKQQASEREDAWYQPYPVEP